MARGNTRGSCEHTFLHSWSLRPFSNCSQLGLTKEGNSAVTGPGLPALKTHHPLHLTSSQNRSSLKPAKAQCDCKNSHKLFPNLYVHTLSSHIYSGLCYLTSFGQLDINQKTWGKQRLGKHLGWRTCPLSGCFGETCVCPWWCDAHARCWEAHGRVIAVIPADTEPTTRHVSETTHCTLCPHRASPDQKNCPIDPQKDLHPYL